MSLWGGDRFNRPRRRLVSSPADDARELVSLPRAAARLFGRWASRGGAGDAGGGGAGCRGCTGSGRRVHRGRWTGGPRRSPAGRSHPGRRRQVGGGSVRLRAGAARPPSGEEGEDRLAGGEGEPRG